MDYQSSTRRQVSSVQILSLKECSQTLSGGCKGSYMEKRRVMLFWQFLRIVQEYFSFIHTFRRVNIFNLNVKGIYILHI